MHHQAHGYFGFLGIGNVLNQVHPNPLVISDLKKLSNNEQYLHDFYDKAHSDIIAEEIEFYKTEEESIRIFNSSIICIINHTNI